jgi:hypothetical protein
VRDNLSQENTIVLLKINNKSTVTINNQNIANNNKNDNDNWEQKPAKIWLHNTYHTLQN